MAITLSIPSSRFEGVRVKPSDIKVVWENNKSRAFQYSIEDVRDLLLDFSEGRSIQQPLTVRKVDALPELIAGYRRLFASLVWERGDTTEGIEPHPDFTVPILFAKNSEGKDPTPTEIMVLNARENIVRKNLSPIDLGSLAVTFEEHGLTNEDTASKLGVSPAQITQHKKLVRDLPEFIQILVHNKTLTADDAFTILKVAPDSRLDVLNRFLESKGTEILDSSSSSSEEPPFDSSPAVDSAPGEDGSSGDSDSSNNQREKKSRSLRDLATEAGANVGSKRMPEFRRYLQEALDTEGPGSNKGEVALKKEILRFLDGKLTERQMDNKFDKFCRVGG